MRPHQTNIGNREFRQMLTAIRRLAGHDSIGPSPVEDQSVDCSNSPHSGEGLPVPDGTVSSGCGVATRLIESRRLESERLSVWRR